MGLFGKRHSGLEKQLGEMSLRLGQLEVLLKDLDNRWQQISNQEQQRRWLAVGDLRAYEKQINSQNGEDGIIAEIFRRIGTKNQYFVEFGVESGVQCNCAHLALDQGWPGLFLEADPDFFAQLADRYQAYPRVRCVRAAVTSDNIEHLLETHGVPPSFDLLSIDIDGNDYWVWSALRRWQPRVVIVEYNASHPPPRRWVMQENVNHRWDGTSYFGASLASLVALGRDKGYELVGTNSIGINAFFVLKELVTADWFLDPALTYHYSPPRYGTFLGGHPPGEGPWVDI
jgi:hypothetical protein